MTRTRGWTVAALVVAAGLVLAGCGGQPFPTTQAAPRPVPAAQPKPPATPQARLLAAIQSATSARTARFTLTASLSGFGDDGDGAISGTGAIDMAHDEMTMTIAANAAGKSVSFEMRMVGGMIYVRDGAKWESGSVSGVDAQSPNPAGYLDYLKGVSGIVRVEGRDTVRGDATTRYGATIDLARAITRDATPAQQALLRSALSQFGALKIPVTVWVDDLGRLRKLQMSMDLGAVADKLGAPAGADPKVEVTMELYDFGLPVVVVAPVGATNIETEAQDNAAESDLRNALTTEKVLYTDSREYSANPAALKQVEPSLDWGGKLSVVLGPSVIGPDGAVCLSERSASGTTFAIADVAEGPGAGTFYARATCPPTLTKDALAGFGASW